VGCAALTRYQVWRTNAVEMVISELERHVYKEKQGKSASAIARA
jgi:hypothetical protein